MLFFSVRAHLVDQVTGGGRLAGVDVADDDNVDVNLFLSHPEGLDPGTT